MGVEPFLLASSLIGVLSQRLVRVLDPATREAYAATPAELAACGRDPGERVTLYRPGPGVTGKNGGYKGRSGVYELVAIDDTLRRLIHDGASEQAIEAHARTRSPSIGADGWDKCVAGVTTVDEVLRVTRED
jgi:general secretion pathway protein E